MLFSLRLLFDMFIFLAILFLGFVNITMRGCYSIFKSLLFFFIRLDDHM